MIYLKLWYTIKKLYHYQKQYYFLNEERISCERFALFKLGLESASEKVISNMFMNFCECYKKWGTYKKTK